MIPDLPGLISLLVLLLLGVLLSAAHAALSNARRQDLRDMAEQGDKRARLAVQIAEDSSRVLNTFRLASLLTYFLIAGLVADMALPRLSEWGQRLLRAPATISYIVGCLIVIPLVAMLVFVLVEMIPETLVGRKTETTAIALAVPAQAVIILLSPLVGAVTSLRRNMMMLLGGEPETTLITEEKIMTLVDVGEEEGAIEQEEKEMIYSIFQLDETLTREIMVPRIDIVALEVGTPLEEAREAIIRAGHSRIPVYEGTLDHIKGLLYAKDLINLWHEGQDTLDLPSLLRSAPFVPETKRVSDLLRELQAAQVHMAIVIDEYGGTAGLVTLEDIVEEIFGEILDEYDMDEEAPYELLTPDEGVFDARIDLDDFNRLLDTDLPDAMGDTLGGFIYGHLGKIPQSGEMIETNGLRIEVLSVADQRIRKVRVKRSLAPKGFPGTGNSHDANRATR